MPKPTPLTLGAHYLGNDRCRFRVWAPKCKKVAVHTLGLIDRTTLLKPQEDGYFEGVVQDVERDGIYFYVLDGDKERPDPASRHQPQGVHGPSQVVEPGFDWQDGGWFSLPLEDYVIYELHVGTFTPEGTFEAIIPHLDGLKELGITAIELMPLAQFPGVRNWGYDGTHLFAVQQSYGGPDGLKRLVNACHQKGLAVVLDVVYNHLGPEGNYLWDYAPYFTERYRTPWGPALNFDGHDSDQVRKLFLENALYWQTDCHIDALRLDAINYVKDLSAYTFVEELAEVTRQQAEALNRRFHLIGETDADDARLIRPRELGGQGLDAQWSDGFHHSIHTLLTGERNGYYLDYGQIDHLVRAYRDGYVYTGQYSPYRRRRQGNSPRGCPGRQFVVCAQNHDQTGNRMLGERLSALTDLEGQKLAAAAVILSPYVPLLFMGEEYGETNPFVFFTNHGDPGLIEAVRKGRKEEFAQFRWQGEPLDPQDEATFQRSKLQHGLKEQPAHRALLKFYRELLRLRKTVPSLAQLSKEHMEVTGFEKQKTIAIRRWADLDETVQVYNYGSAETKLTVPFQAGKWQRRLDSAAPQWQGPGSRLPDRLDSEGEALLTLGPRAMVLYSRE